MKTAAVILASILNVFVLGPAFAHGDHAAQHGGVVGRPDEEIVVEFVMEKETVSMYVHDQAGAPIQAKELTGTLTLIAPHRTQDVKLVVAGPHKLTAPGVAPVRGDRLRARIVFPNGEVFESVALFPGEIAGKPRFSFAPDTFVLPGPSSVTGELPR